MCLHWLLNTIIQNIRNSFSGLTVQQSLTRQMLPTTRIYEMGNRLLLLRFKTNKQNEGTDTAKYERD